MKNMRRREHLVPARAYKWEHSEANNSKSKLTRANAPSGETYCTLRAVPQIQSTYVHVCLWTETDVNHKVTLIPRIYYAGHSVVCFCRLIRRLHTWGILDTESLWTAAHSLVSAWKPIVSPRKLKWVLRRVKWIHGFGCMSGKHRRHSSFSFSCTYYRIQC